jgi:hypothetical protein
LLNIITADLSSLWRRFDLTEYQACLELFFFAGDLHTELGPYSGTYIQPDVFHGRGVLSIEYAPKQELTFTSLLLIFAQISSHVHPCIKSYNLPDILHLAKKVRHCICPLNPPSFVGAGRMTWTRGKFAGDGYDGEWDHDAIHGKGPLSLVQKRRAHREIVEAFSRRAPSAERAGSAIPLGRAKHHPAAARGAAVTK